MVFSGEKKQDLSVRQLIECYRETQDQNYVVALFERYAHLIQSVCLKHLKNPDDCKDATVDIYLLLLDRLLGQEVDYFNSWLYVVVRNYCRSYLNKKKRQPTSRLDDEELELQLWKIGSYEHLSSDSDRNETKHRVRAAVQELRQEQRNCITGRYFDGKTYREIAAEFGYSEKSVKSYIENGRRNLRIKLSDLKKEE